MTTSTKSFCMSCVLDREVDPQTGRCLTCGHQVVKTSTQAKPDGNTGAPPRGPSQAYRDFSAPFEASRSVAATGPANRETNSGQAAASTPTAGARPELPNEVLGPSDPVAGAETESTHSAREGLNAEPRAARAPLPPPDKPTLGQPRPAWIAETRALGDELSAAALVADQQAEIARAIARGHAEEAARLRKSAAVFAQLLAQFGAAVVNDVDDASPSTDTPPEKPFGTRWSKNSSVQVDACVDCGRADVPHIANGRCRTCDGRWRTAQKASS